MRKTIFRKGEHSVEVTGCSVVRGEKLYNFYIAETKAYFMNEKRAIRAANDLLLKKSLSEHRYLERKQEERKMRGVHRVVHLSKGIEDTKAYIKRWDGELYLETKKNLLNEMVYQLATACKKYGFKNEAEAIRFKERIERRKR